MAVSLVCDIDGSKGSDRWHKIKITVDEETTEMDVCHKCYEGLGTRDLGKRFGEFIEQKNRLTQKNRGKS